MPDGKGRVRLEYNIPARGLIGFRNQFDLAFDQNGELHTYDSDMEWDQGTPWYVPTRINHVVSGGEYGWRNGAGKYPEFYPDNLPATLNIGPGSPTGVAFGYGAKFPAKYQEALYILDWSWGKLYAVHLKPEGSSYTATREEFLSGAPLPLTDAVIHPQDGAMYFAIGGRKVQSGLYRVTYTGKESTAPAKIPANPAAAFKLIRITLLFDYFKPFIMASTLNKSKFFQTQYRRLLANLEAASQRSRVSNSNAGWNGLPTKSLPPPGAKGTTSRIGRAG